MDAILRWLTFHFHNFPLVAFIALILGGFNIPISEDVLVVMSAVLCQAEKANIPIFYLSIFFGAAISDWLVYFWGWLLGRGIISNRFFKKIIKKENTIRFSRALDKYGVFTYIIVRFIPFGVRNIMSMTSGFVGFNFYKFILFDALAVLCNTSTLFWLVYFFGKTGGTFFKIFGITLFCLFVILCIYMFRSKRFIRFIDERLKIDNSLKDEGIKVDEPLK